MALFLLTQVGPASAQITAFSYQGRIEDNAAPANGFYDLSFALYTNSVGGSAFGPILTNAGVPVSNGIFTEILDFGNAFNGNRCWLEIGIRTNSASSNFVILSPRQEITPTPYALFSQTVSASGIVGIIPDAQLSTNIPRLGSNALFTGAIQ